MSSDAPTLRPFTWTDVPAITAIYRHYVENSVATFDTEPPGESFMAEKFGHMVDARHPVVIAELGGRLAGYAYASMGDFEAGKESGQSHPPLMR